VQVVGLVDGHQVPAGCQGLCLNFGPGLKKVQAAQHQLLRLEGVALRHLCQAIRIVQGKVQVEAAQHLYQPLV
jgi:hypothetical protein